MSEPIDDDLPEIRVEAYDKIDQWRVKLNETEKLKKRDVFERAAADLFLEAEYERDLRAVQAITDAIYILGRDYTGLDDDSIQFVMVGVRSVAERPTSGRSVIDEGPPPALSPDDYGVEADSAHTSDAATAIKNLPVAYPLQAFANISLDTGQRNYLVKGLLANSGLAVIWGPPKCGKSFWVFDLGMHIALGRDYRGHRVQQATVVYVALEGKQGFPARKEAFRRHHGIESAPFYLLSTSLDLVAKSSELIASIKAQLGTDLPGVLFLDTLNRSLVGSESRDEDMARFLAAAEKVAQELNCAVVIVHHCGIDASRPRGHTSLSGAVESQLKVERGNTGEVIVTVELAKDFAEGIETVSRLERVPLGTDLDGDEISSLVVLPAETSSRRARRPRANSRIANGSRSRPWTNAQSTRAKRHRRASNSRPA